MGWHGSPAVGSSRMQLLGQWRNKNLSLESLHSLKLSYMQPDAIHLIFEDSDSASHSFYQWSKSQGVLHAQLIPAIKVCH